MEASLLRLESQVGEMKESLSEIRAENATLRKEISGKENPPAPEVSNEESSELQVSKTLRAVVEEIASEVKNIGAHVVSSEKCGETPKPSFDVPPWVHHHLISKDFNHFIPRFPEGGTLRSFDIDLLEDEVPLFTPIPSEADNDLEDVLLQLKEADLKFEENGKLHHTKDYDLMRRKCKQMIIRRGQEFSIDLSFNRPYARGTDSIKFVFVMEGKHKRENFDTVSFSLDPAVAILEMKDERPAKWSSDWNAYFGNVNETTITVQLKAPPRCPIGKWRLRIELKSEKSKSSREYQFSKSIYILCNPWWSEDDTYYSREEHLEDYVLSPTGTIFIGKGENDCGGHSVVPKSVGLKWAYEQFAPNILDCAIYLLDHKTSREKPLTVPERGDVVTIVRRLSSLLNYNESDSEGILWGRWLGNFPHGERPDHWSGSKEILQQYYRSKINFPSRDAAVKYGQCWVFPGVLTTICRALGIPCRPVTNFSSGHEKLENGYSFAINEFVDKNGTDFNADVYDNYNFDEIWNYHVWCEIWTRRLDIGDLFTGWQVVDGTCQEQGDQIYQMGPAPVNACKRGQVDVSYDVNSLYSEVNSDVVQWQWLGPRKHKFISIVSKNRVGKYLCTKDVNSNKAEDLTKCYRHKEGSCDERNAKQNALSLVGLHYNRNNFKEREEEVTFRTSIPDAVIGSDFRFDIVVRNKNPNQLHQGSVWVKVYSAPVYYKRKRIADFKLDFTVESEVPLPCVVEYDKYKKYIEEDGNLQVCYFAVVNNTEIAHANRGHFSFTKPRITLNVLDTRIYLQRNFTTMVTIENPLPVPIEDGMFSIHVPGCSRIQKKLELNGPLQPGETASVNFELQPRKHGRIDVIANFHSDSAKIMANGSIDVEILDIESEVELQH